jgi:hypothetical protein
MSAADDFFRYNLPIQVMPGDGMEVRVLLYMPRKERLSDLVDLDEVLPEGMTREQFFSRTADIYENLAKLMRHAATVPRSYVYYPDAEPQVLGD